MVNKKILDRSKITKDDIARAYTDASAIIEAEWEEGEQLFIPFSDKGAASASIDNLTPAQCIELVDKMSGNSGSVRGEAPKAGTPSSLYAQMTENSSNNIADMVDWFNGLVRLRDYKTMKTVQQFYKDRRYIEISGKKYSEESKWYDPEKVRNSQFDLSLIESQSSGVFRAKGEDALLFMLQNGIIDGQMYLENTTMPFADNMLEGLKRRQDEMAQAQQNMPPQEIQGQPGVSPAAAAATPGLPIVQPA